MHTSTRHIMDRRIRSKMSRRLRIVWQASIVRWWSACSLSTGAAFWCPHRYKSRGFKSGVERGGHAVGPPVPIPRSWQVLLRTSHTARLKCAGAPSCMYHTGALLPVVQLPVALADNVRGNVGSGCLQVDVAKHAGLPNNHQHSLPIQQCWTAAGVNTVCLQQ
jgi:hypothetical protein